MRLTRILLTASKLPKSWSNFPEEHVKRVSEQIEWKTPRGRQYRRAVIKRPDSDFVYGVDPPWTDGFREKNQLGRKNFAKIVEPVEEMFFRGDRVQILVGKDKGKQGLINYIVRERNWVCVEGLNFERKEVRNMGRIVIVPVEKPLLMFTQVALVDPGDEKVCQAQWRYSENNERVRVSLRSGRIIPIPSKAAETYDYKTKSTYVDKPKDTPAGELAKITFLPKLGTFEMDIMEEQGIKDDRVPQKFYWY